MHQRHVLAALLAVAASAPDLAQAASREEIEALIEQTARSYNVPVEHVHRIVRRESNYNPRASAGGALGLMQIKHATARGVGYRGDASGLFDPAINLKYGIAYFAGAYRLANGNYDQAYRYYNRGYYFAAKARGIGATPVIEDPAPVVAALPAASTATGFASLFAPRHAAAAPTAQLASADLRSAVAGSPALAYAASSTSRSAQAYEVPLPPRRPTSLGLDTGVVAVAASAPLPSSQPAAAVAVAAAAVAAVEVPVPPRRPTAQVLAAVGRPVIVARAVPAPAPVREATALVPAQ